MNDQELITVMLQINSLHPIKMADTALLLLPAHNELIYRYTEPLKCIPSYVETILIAGHRELPTLSKEYVCERYRLSKDSVFFQEYAENTAQQTNWVVNLLVDFKQIIVSTGVYHTPRAFLTLLKSLSKQDKKVIISTLPVLNPEYPELDLYGFKETGSTGIVGEIERIKKYTNDIASLVEYWEYIKWRQQ